MTRLLAIDQGTTGTTSLVVDITRGRPVHILGRGYADFPQHFPRSGWVEHDLDEIWQSVLRSSRAALEAAQIDSKELAAVSLANQRETTAVWDDRGRPLARAIVWQDRRTAEACHELEARGALPMVRQKCGLVLDPYFSASKLDWLLTSNQAVAKAQKEGALRCGTIDAWLIWKLTGGQQHRCDATNAARTLLYDIHRECWDDDLIGLWPKLSQRGLPEVMPSDATFGEVRGVAHLPDGLPITGVAGDQNAALVGQACVADGMAKCTLGTGAFLLVNTGERPVLDSPGLLGTLGWRTRAQRAYALEGSLFVAGALVQWFRDNLKIISRSADIEALAREVPDAGGVSIVPALTGLGAPHWRSEARGLIAGISRGTNASHLARACLEGIAMQTVDLVDAMQRAGGLGGGTLRVDGGAAANNLLLQMHADGLGLAVERPACVDTTALGAVFLGALGIHEFSRMDDITHVWQAERRFESTLTPEQRRAKLAAWHALLPRA